MRNTAQARAAIGKNKYADIFVERLEDWGKMTLAHTLADKGSPLSAGIYFLTSTFRAEFNNVEGKG